MNKPLTRTYMIELTHNHLRDYGDRKIQRRLRNKGYKWSEELWQISEDIATYNEALFHLLESDQGWSKEYTNTCRNYKQACKIAYKLMKRR